MMLLVKAYWAFSDRTGTFVLWRKHFSLKLFRTFTDKMTRGLSILFISNLLFQETVFVVASLETLNKRSFAQSQALMSSLL